MTIKFEHNGQWSQSCESLALDAFKLKIVFLENHILNRYNLTVIHIKASSSGIFLLKDGKKQTVVLILHNYNTAGCISDDECIYPKICVDGKCIVVGMSHNIQRELKQSVSVVCLLPPVQFLVRVQQR